MHPALPLPDPLTHTCISCTKSSHTPSHSHSITHPSHTLSYRLNPVPDPLTHPLIHLLTPVPDRAADRCINVLLDLIQTKVNYVVQEAIVVIKDIFRKYPNRYESIIATLCENLEDLDEPEAKVHCIHQYTPSQCYPDGRSQFTLVEIRARDANTQRHSMRIPSPSYSTSQLTAAFFSHLLLSFFFKK